MHGTSKRKLIVAALLLACSVVSLLLLTQQSDSPQLLTNLNTADSLIASTCHSFNINKSAWHVQTIPVSPHFQRKIWHISLPVNLSQTFFHYNLAQILYPYGIQTSARVNLRKATMDIQLYYQHTIIRTVAIRNDTNSVRYDVPGSIVLFFDRQPDATTAGLIRSLGEPIMVAFKTDRVVQTDSWIRVSGIEDFSIAYWIEPGSSQGQNAEDKWYLGEQLRNLTRMIHHPVILIGPDDDDTQRNLWEDICRKRGLRAVDASDALWISEDTPAQSITNVIQRFYKQASLGRRPILIMAADKKNIEELKRTIPGYRKKGLVIVSPIRNVE